MVAEGPLADPFVIADLPGLIAGAASGSGLGFQFLRHVERCRVLAHLVDLSNPEADCGADLATIEQELEAFNPELLTRARLIVGSKLDAALPERRRELQAAAEKRGLPCFEISSVTGKGVKELVYEMRHKLRTWEDV